MLILFLNNFGISLLGAWLFLLIRAACYAKSLFSLTKFIRENYVRWSLIPFILIVVQLILLIEGQAILKILVSYGMIMPTFSNAVIGFGASWLTCKAVKKKSII